MDDDDEVRSALRSLCQGTEPTLDDVVTLIHASADYAVSLVPQAAVEALAVRSEIRGDLSNGGMDQVAWNHGHQLARLYADSLWAVGAIENADLLARLAAEVEGYRKTHGDAISENPIPHFLAYRKLVGGPFFQVPEFDDELA